MRPKPRINDAYQDARKCISIDGKWYKVGAFVFKFRFNFYNHANNGHVGQAQRSHWSRSNKDSKERQVGSQQRQVASFKNTRLPPCKDYITSLHSILVYMASS